jgi:hypothetical protein
MYVFFALERIEGLCGRGAQGRPICVIESGLQIFDLLVEIRRFESNKLIISAMDYF